MVQDYPNHPRKPDGDGQAIVEVTRVVVDLRCTTFDWATNHRGTDHGSLGARFNEEELGAKSAVWK